MSFIERSAVHVGSLAKPVLDHLVEKRISTFEIETQGLEHLQALRGKPYILAANHPVPQDKIVNISADSAVIYSVVRETNGQDLHFVSHYGEEWLPGSQYLPNSVKKGLLQFQRGFSEGYRTIVLDISPHAFHRNLITGAQHIFQEGHPLLIYPYGHWHTDEELVGNVQSGAAHLARRFEVPILPAYLRGGTSWKPGAQTTVVFGESFHVNQDIQTTNQRIEESILGLRSQLPLAYPPLPSDPAHRDAQEQS